MAMIDTQEYVRRVHKRHGDKYTVLSEYKGSTKKIHVRYNPCGHERWVSTGTPMSGTNCGKCYEIERDRRHVQNKAKREADKVTLLDDLSPPITSIELAEQKAEEMKQPTDIPEAAQEDAPTKETSANNAFKWIRRDLQIGEIVRLVDIDYNGIIMTTKAVAYDKISSSHLQVEKIGHAYRDGQLFEMLTLKCNQFSVVIREESVKDIKEIGDQQTSKAVYLVKSTDGKTHGLFERRVNAHIKKDAINTSTEVETIYFGD